MARRTKAELLVELRRVGALWDAWRDYWIAHGSPDMRDSISRDTRSSEDRLADLGPGGPRLSALLAGTQQAVNDASEGIGYALQDGEPWGRDFLAFYRERTGRDWWADEGDPAKMARAILRRGRIRDETEWYLLENILTNVEQTVFSATEVERHDVMRLKFEEKVSGRVQKSWFMHKCESKVTFVYR